MLGEIDDPRLINRCEAAIALEAATDHGRFPRPRLFLVLVKQAAQEPADESRIYLAGYRLVLHITPGAPLLCNQATTLAPWHAPSTMRDADWAEIQRLLGCRDAADRAVAGQIFVCKRRLPKRARAQALEAIQAEIKESTGAYVDYWRFVLSVFQESNPKR